MSKVTSRSSAGAFFNERRVEWGLNGFGVVLLLYIVGSVTLDAVPDALRDRAAWLGLGMLVSILGMVLAAALADLSG